jgi:hypothetical protein
LVRQLVCLNVSQSNRLLYRTSLSFRVVMSVNAAIRISLLLRFSVSPRATVRQSTSLLKRPEPVQVKTAPWAAARALRQVEERAVERAALRQRAAARELAAERAAERAALAERAAARAALRQQVEERRAALREVEEQAVERAALRSSSSSLPVTVGLYISHSFIRLAFRQ